MHLRPAARPVRVLLAVTTGMISATLFAAPASAHVEVTADNPQAGARNVTVTFKGEAESDSAGIISERVVLPAGIPPQDVRLAKAPAGWTLTTNADGFTAGGTPLPAGQDAVFSVTIAQLPTDATELAFKTVESYSNGKVSRWIEVPQPGAAEPANPAPVLKLQPAAAPAPSSVAPTTSSPAATTPAPTASPTTAASDDTGTSRTGLWLTIAAVVVVAATAGALLVARRRRQPSPTGR